MKDIYSFIMWVNGLEPSAFAVVMGVPTVGLAALVASYFKWRDDRRDSKNPHAAE
jgi:hypothetical protein